MIDIVIRSFIFDAASLEGCQMIDDIICPLVIPEGSNTILI